MTMPDLWVVNEHLTDGYAVYDRSARTYVTPTRTTLDEARDDFAELIAAGLPTASDVLVALAEAELAVNPVLLRELGRQRPHRVR